MIEMIFITLIIIVTPLAFFFVIPFLYSGIHYEKTTKSKIKTITKFIYNITSKKNNSKLSICDLGSGNADILINLAKNTSGSSRQFFGFEINPFLTLISKYKIKKLKINYLIKIYKRNLWKQDLSKFNIIIIFQFKTYMKKLENKIKKECQKGTLIISNHWKLPNLKLIKKENDIYFYEI